MFAFIHDDITAGGKLMRSAKSTGWAGEMPNILKYVRTPGSWSQNSYDTSSMTSTSMLAGYTSATTYATEKRLISSIFHFIDQLTLLVYRCRQFLCSEH